MEIFETHFHLNILPDIMFQDKVILGFDGSSIHCSRFSLPAKFTEKLKERKIKLKKQIQNEHFRDHVISYSFSNCDAYFYDHTHYDIWLLDLRGSKMGTGK